MRLFFKKYIKQILGACFLAIGIYLPSFNAPFQFDDYRIIVNNILIKAPTKIERIWRWDPSRFLSHMTFALNYAFGKKEVFSYHVVNFVLHLATSLSVLAFAYLILNKLYDRRGGKLKEDVPFIAFFAFLLFLVHPIQTSAVTYIVERSAILATFFYIWALIGYILYRENNQRRFYALSLSAAFLGCFCKPIIITLPLAIAAYEHVSTYPRRESFKKTIFKVFPYFLVILLVPLLLILWRYKQADLSKYMDITRETTYLTRSEYLLTQINVVRTYLRLLFYPVHQNLDYDYGIVRTFWNYPTVLSFALLSSVLALGMAFLKKQKVISFAIFWFFITLSLESSVFPIADVIFEHRLYLPLAGFVLLVPVCISAVVANKQLRTILLVIIIAVLSVLTFKRNLVWHNAVEFMESIQSQSANKSRIYNSLGFAYYKAGKVDEAERAFKKCLTISPTGVIASRARNNLGIIYYNRGDYVKAFEEFQQALKFSEGEHAAAIAYNHMGRIRLAQEKWQEAIDYYTKALDLSPLMYESLNNRGAVYRKQGKFESALKDYNHALAINPVDEDVFSNKGLLFRILGRYDQSLEEYAKAIKANRKDAQLYYDRGIVYKEMKQYNLAVKDFNQALKLKSDYKEVYNERGIVLSRAKLYDLALEDYTRALAIDNTFFDAYYNRSLLYLKTKDYLRALDDCEQAILLDSAFANTYYTKALAYYSLGDYASAEKALAEVFKREPNNPKALQFQKQLNSVL